MFICTGLFNHNNPLVYLWEVLLVNCERPVTSIVKLIIVTTLCPEIYQRVVMIINLTILVTGRSQLTNRVPPRDIPEGCYDY
jgi:hypothetical protein